MENGIGSKGYAVGLYLIGEDLHCGDRRQNMKVDFYKSGSNNIVYTSRFRRGPTPIHSIKFWGKSLLPILRKLGNSPKLPSRISRERFELQGPNSVVWSRTSIPTRAIFFRIFERGVGERGRFQFLKKIGGGQTANQLQGPFDSKGGIV